MPGLYAAWRSRDDGWSAFICEPLLRVALGHLDGMAPGSTVLDVGCGFGHVTCALAAAGHHAVGLDPDGDALRDARARDPAGRWLRARAEAIPLADGSVDAVFSLSVLQYTERAAALAECRRVLRPGGRFAIVENLAGNPVARGYRLLRRAGMRGLPEFAPPRAHLEWGGRDLYGRFFREVSFHPVHLLAPAAILTPAARRGPGGGLDEAGLSAPLRALRRIDAALLRTLPPLRAAAWTVVACGIR